MRLGARVAVVYQAWRRVISLSVERSRTRPRAEAAVVSEYQRSRVLAAALAEASECGGMDMSVTAIVARAGVSRKTFYELFENRDDCIAAAFARAIAELADVVVPAYEQAECGWPGRLRAALVELLAFLEIHRDIGTFVLGYMAVADPRDPACRRLRKSLCGVVERGAQAGSISDPSPLAGEVVVEGTLAILKSRLCSRSVSLSALVNPLMWMIVLPYLGSAAAARELRYTSSSSTGGPSWPDESALAGLRMRVTYRTARVLGAIAEEPGRSNIEVGARAGIADAGQISKLLARLLALELVVNVGAGWAAGSANAWRLTRKGERVHAAIGQRFTINGVF